MRDPGIARFLEDKDEFVVTEDARGINDERFIKEALPALSKVLTEDRFTDEALIRQANKACLSTGTEEPMRYIVRSEERRVAIECLSTCRYRSLRPHKNKTPNHKKLHKNI